MNNPTRTELLAILSVLSDRYPDWRLGQLVANIADWSDRGIWDVEDAELIQAAQLHLQQPAMAKST